VFNPPEFHFSEVTFLQNWYFNCHAIHISFILSGPPGAGKSTTCQLMAKEAGYVYYEADCTTNNLNPFIGTDVENPTIAAIRQKPLKVIFPPFTVLIK
jgi:ATP-dependent protease Clp ATPase subunit